MVRDDGYGRVTCCGAAGYVRVTRRTRGCASRTEVPAGRVRIDETERTAMEEEKCGAGMFCCYALAAALPRLSIAQRDEASGADPHRPHAGLSRRPGHLPQRVARLPRSAGSGRAVRFVQRGSYREIVDLLRSGQAGFRLGVRLSVRASPARTAPAGRAAVPGQAALPVLSDRSRNRQPHALDPRSARQGVRLLRPRFQFRLPLSDLLAWSGCTSGRTPSSARTFFTWAHRKVVEAVAARAGAGRRGGWLRVGNAGEAATRN